MTYYFIPDQPSVFPRFSVSLAMQLSVAAVVDALSVVSGIDGYINSWDQPFLFACHNGEVLTRVYSYHSNGAEDRRWSFSCGSAPGGASPYDCYWTNYVNTWDEPINFMCSMDYVIAGIQSYHWNEAEDRRFKFKCCKDSSYETYSCSLTGYLQSWDQTLDYTVPSGKVLVGWFSVHWNHAEDRRHKMMTCYYR